MLFNSLSFLVFFPVVTLLYFALQHRWRWAWLLLASCVFYMAFVPVYILILLITIVIDYFAGILIGSAQGRARKGWLLASLLANIGVLAVFKYWGFLETNIGGLSAWLGFTNPLPALDIILPIGLSFHTFQAMSYTLEVYAGRQEPERHFGIYALYVMFYPQLVAGPIERPQNLLHQFRVPAVFDYERVVSGLQLMALGLFKKVVVADRLAQAAGGGVWEAPHQHHGIELLAAVVCFAFQVYLDFSAYSEIAIGSARVMGIDLMQNFDTPYASRSVSEFWRRWHISLSTWFRDYVYVPLGGSRTSKAKHFRNLMVVFLLSGLWHGANWTFVIWGGLHGLYLIAGQLTRPGRDRLADMLGWARESTSRKVAGTLVTFALVTFAWIFFRAPSLDAALDMIRHLPRGLPEDIGGLLQGRTFGLVSAGSLLRWSLLVVAILVFEAAHRRRNVFERMRSMPLPVRHAAYAALIYGVVFLAVPEDVQFIYFQF